jgi:hypothetical protein
MASTLQAPPTPGKQRGKRSRARATAGAFGLLVLLAGLVGGGVLFLAASQRHDDVVESFARAGVGCTTTLEFGETGTFYVFEETTTEPDLPSGGCQPVLAPGEFQFTLTGPADVVRGDDTSISYDTGSIVGSSVARIEITRAGTYEILVTGPDLDAAAAVGRDPSSGVSDMKRGALIVAIAGVALGGLLLLLAGRRSRGAAEPSAPVAPAWGPRPDGVVPDWPPHPPRVGQLPVDRSEPGTAAPPPPPLPARVTPAAPSPSPWAPPPTGLAPTTAPPPVDDSGPRLPPPPVPREPDPPR